MIKIFIYQLIQKILEYSQLPAKAQNKNLRQFRGILQDLFSAALCAIAGKTPRFFHIVYWNNLGIFIILFRVNLGIVLATFRKTNLDLIRGILRTSLWYHYQFWQTFVLLIARTIVQGINSNFWQFSSHSFTKNQNTFITLQLVQLEKSEKLGNKSFSKVVELIKICIVGISFIKMFRGY